MSGRVRRARGAEESLAQVVLGFESIIVFLGGLAIYGLNALPDGIPSWWGIVGGSVLAALMVITTGLTRSRVGILLGWLWQVVVVLESMKLFTSLAAEIAGVVSDVACRTGETVSAGKRLVLIEPAG